MNKYIREWMLSSGVRFLREFATLSIRKKHSRRHESHQKIVHEALYGASEFPRVLNGPFEGMLYINETVWGSITPRWIGSYERCLWRVVDEIVSRRYRRILDVGCAEGYYAVGLCRIVPDVDLYAFDMDSESRRQLLRLWKLNGCPGKLTVGELLSFEGLMNLGAPGTLLICDIEGGEMELLNPLHCAALYKMDILVEVHRTGGCSVEENAASLLKRFSQSHMIESLPPSQVTEGLCGVSNLDENLLRQALSEGRPYPQVWLWMKASTLNT